MKKMNQALLWMMSLCALATSNAVTASAADFGDRDCNIFTSWASNESGAYSRYEFEIKVSKGLIRKHFQRYVVGILRFQRNAQFIPAKLVSQDANFLTFRTEITPGALYRSESTSFIAYITNGIDTLYDNNFSGNMISLDAGNNWVYRGGNCR